MNPYQQIFDNLGIKSDVSLSTGLNWKKGNGDVLQDYSPINNDLLATLNLCNQEDYSSVVAQSKEAFEKWKNTPAPQRGEIVRQYGDALRQHKQDLGKLVTIEMGKSLQEGLGEVQEMIDVCDFAVGLSRQLCGQTMHSERPNHRMYEQWHPLGIVGIISAFNFPVAVWAWNAMIAAVCGNVCIWKPSEKTPLTAIACHKILEDVLRKNNVPEAVFSLVLGDARIGEAMAKDKNIILISATGSTKMGRSVAQNVAQRLGKSLLELGGNNAVIITANADLKKAISSVVFGAIGTAGQRCTSTRRVIIHDSIYDSIKNNLVEAYKKITIGNPLDEAYFMGPIIDQNAVSDYLEAIKLAQLEGGKLLVGGDIVKDLYVEPTIIEVNNNYTIVQKETFVPILYLIKYSGDVLDAIAIQNNVSQGLSSSIFSDNIQETEIFLSVIGSDCGIANVNIGTSGAEIGGAFGGEKDTGGGRESGSDSWKAYMRRQTNTINYGDDFVLAQGIQFNFD